MMMTMDQPNAGFGDFGAYSSDPFTSNQSTSPPMSTDPDVDWSVFENAERYLLRDDSAWITRLSKDFWWNLDRISEMITAEFSPTQSVNNNNNNNGAFNRPNTKFNPPPSGAASVVPPPSVAKAYSQQQAPPPPPMQFAGAPPRKIVGQRSQMPGNNNPYRNNSMFNNGFASPPPSSSSSSSSSGSTIVRPINNNNNSNFNIPDKSNFFQAFSSMSIMGGGGGGGVGVHHDQDMEYNPFQSKISFDNNMWGNNSQQPIPWQ